MDNLLKAATERIKRKKMLEEEMRQYRMSESDRIRMRNLLRNKETNFLRLSRAKLSLDMFEVRETLGKVLLVASKSKLTFYSINDLIRNFRALLVKFPWSRRRTPKSIMHSKR